MQARPMVPVPMEIFRVQAVLSRWKVVLAHLDGTEAFEGSEQHTQWLLPVEVEQLELDRHPLSLDEGGGPTLGEMVLKRQARGSEDAVEAAMCRRSDSYGFVAPPVDAGKWKAYAAAECAVAAGQGASTASEDGIVIAVRADGTVARRGLVAAFFIVLGVLAAAGPAAAYLWLVAATGNGNHAYFLGLAHCLAASVLATKALAWHVPRRRALAA